jgi:hypothetical protein
MWTGKVTSVDQDLNVTVVYTTDKGKSLTEIIKVKSKSELLSLVERRIKQLDAKDTAIVEIKELVGKDVTKDIAEKKKVKICN